MECIEERVFSTLFIESWSTSKVLNIGNKIQQEVPEFDGDPLTIPNNAPPEIPRLILRDKEEKLKLGLGLNQLIIENVKDSRNKVELSKNIILQINNLIFNEFKWTVNRLANVIIYKIITEKPTIKFIKDRYIQNNRLDSVVQLNLHWLRKLNFLNDTVNFWTRINTSEGYENKEMKVIFDLNQIVDTNRKIDKDFADRFFIESFDYIKSECDEMFS